jgi:hypothetical protein
VVASDFPAASTGFVPQDEGIRNGTKDMLVTVTAKVADTMIVDIAQENLDWGYRPFAQGTEVDVVSERGTAAG